MLQLKNKKAIVLLLLFILSSNIFSQDFQLVWEDEFDGSQLNTNKWIYETGPNWANNELQYYSNRPENIFISDGNLVIKALKEEFGGRSYTSARIKTKASWKYGKIEARIKLPYGQGIWPAFWMLGNNIDQVSWPSCGEIDIMEMIGGGAGRDNRIYGTAHWDNNGQHALYGLNYTLSSGIFADNYHVFTAIWNPQKIEWFMDGFKYCTIDITPSGLSEFHNPFFIILNMAVGGIWPGNPDQSTIFPQQMFIDYVKVYQLASSLPNITLNAPADNSNYPAGSDILLSTSVQYSGTIDKVEFYQDAVKIGETDLAPYQWNWKNIDRGCYKLKAVAYTDLGFAASSSIANITVGDDCAETSYSGNAVSIPGIIEVENYNLGGSGIAYHDNDAGNNGNSYRTSEGVDIQQCSDIDGGFNLGWTNTGEWINYKINVKEAGEYEFGFRIASNNSSGVFRIEINDANVTGSIAVQSTGGYQTWSAITKSGILLTEGEKTLRLFVEQGGFNINKIEIFKPNTLPDINLISPNGGEVWTAGAIKEIGWESLKVSNVQIGYSTNGGTSWLFITPLATSQFGVYRWKVPETISENCKVMIVDKNNSSISDASDNVFSITNTTGINGDFSLNNFNLKQNYPNPFNPTTTIGYRIAEFGFVSLKIYDLLGNEIAELLNDEKSPGEYEIEFDTAKYNITSGIYFYQIKSGSFISTRKMTVLK